MIKKVFLHIVFLLFTGIGLFGQFPPITIDSVETSPVSCGGFIDGSITVHISGGSTAGYIYWLFDGSTWSPFPDPDTSFIYTGLRKGPSYTVMVADVNPAWAPAFYPGAVSIGGPDTIRITGTTVTDIKCASDITGSIDVDATGEGDDLLYTLDGGPTSPDGVFTGLDEGTYSVLVSDNTLACPSTDEVLNLVISKPPLLTVTDDLITDVLCYGDNTGAISITAAGGTPDGGPYTYVWTGPGITSPNLEDQTGLIAGDYQVKVIDDNLCEVTGGDYTVAQAPEILMTVNSSDSTTCNGDSDGKVNITVTNGTNPLTFFWQGQDPVNTSIMRNANDLAADIYTLTITDADMCEAVFPDVVQIFEPDPITMTIDDVTDVLCFGEATGSLDITISGGSGSYPTTTWSGPTPSILEDPDNLLAGTYSLKVIDSKSCLKDFTDTVTITQPDEITAVPGTTTDALCFGSGDGQATVTVNNGIPPYSYLWTGVNPANTSTMPSPTDLFADTYDLQITDNNSCVKIFDLNMVVGQPEEITAVINVTDVLCKGFSTGEIDIEPDKGTPPYAFAWTGAGVDPTEEDQTGLAAGFYNVTITDANLCSKDFNNIEVKENEILGASFSITPLTCNLSGDGEIEATISGGVRPHTYSWVSIPAGFTNTTDTLITGLDAVDYVLTVKDFENCEKTFPAQTVTQPDPLVAVFNSTDVTCFDSINGTIDIDITGGTSPYTTNWSNPLPYSSDEDLTNLAPAVYSLYLEDDNNCFINYPNEVTIDEPTEITISETHDDISCAGENNGTISVIASDGSPGYSFLWDGPDGFNETTADIINLKAGQYDLTVTDSHGCPKDFTNVATIVQPDTIKITIVGQTDLDCFGDSDGTVDITTIGGVAPYSHVWKNSVGTIVSTIEDATGLSAGIYSLEITDASLCTVTFTDTIEITEPDEVLISLSKTDVKCNGDSDGTVTVTTTGGIGPYQYRILGGAPYGPANVFTGLGAATHTLYTIDANLCEVSDVITVAQPSQISYSDFGVLGNNKCNGDTDAIIYVNTVNGGVAPYKYSIDGGTTYQDPNTFPNIGGGSYPVMVKDFNQCEVSLGDFNVYEPDSIKITFYTQVDVTTCFEYPDGSISMIASGGSGTLLYSNNGGVDTQSTGVFNNLIGGSYDIQIVDDSLCTRDTIVEITRPPKLLFSQADTLPVIGCSGDSNGEIDALAIGGTPLIQYSLDDITYQVPGLFTGLWASDTTVYAKDSKGCTTDTTVTIIEPVPITLILENALDAGCNGTSTGSVIVEASGGTSPYNYTLNPPVGPPVSQASGTFAGLPAGDYTVDVQDTPLCGPVSSTTLTVGQPDALVVDSVKTDFISCKDASDAEIFVYVSGGTPPYQYSYDDEVSYEASSSKTGLSQGTYIVWVKDANGCIEPVGTYIFVNPAAISLNASLEHVSPCFGGTNGTISASATGGWESFEYSIDGAVYQASGDFSGLAAGDYTIFTIDTGSCSSTINVSITEPAQVTATITKTNYVDDVLGTITITDAAGGVPPYMYSIDGVTGTFTTTTSYIDLIAGSYDVVVRDDSLCPYEETIQIFDILPLTMIIDSSDVSCFGEDDGFIEFQPQDAVGEVLYSIDNSTPSITTPRFENLPGDSMYILRAEDADGKVYWDSVYIVEPPQLIVNSIPTMADCNVYSETGAIDLIPSGGTGGFTFSWSNGSTSEDLSNIVAGPYSVTVTDNSNCSVSEDIVIISWVTMNANAGKDTSICEGETIILNGQAQATDIVMWEPSTYLSNQGISNPSAVNVLDSITYSYRVTETSSGKNCYDIDSLTIAVLPDVGIDVTQDTVALKGQEIQLETTGGTFVSYSWFPTTGLDASDIPDPVAAILNSTLYFVSGTNEYGCIETDSVYIELIENLSVFNAFSPNNGDNINQYFEIQNADAFPEMLVEIFNRWGSRVFSSVGYSDDKRWDGTSRGKDVPIGTYYYIIIPYPNATPITGNVTIIR